MGVEGENAIDGARMGHTKENLIVAQMGELITEGLEFSSLHYDNKEVDSEELASEIVEDFEEELKEMFGTEVAVVEAKEAVGEKTSEDELQLQAQENHFLFSAAASDVTAPSDVTAGSAEELKSD